MGNLRSTDVANLPHGTGHPEGLGAPLDILPGNISTNELNVFRMQYQGFRAGKAAGAKGEGPKDLIRDPSSRLGPLTQTAAAQAVQGQASKVAVIGGGAYGSAMATVCARNGHKVCIYARDESQCQVINEEHRNPKYLSEFELPTNLRATPFLAEAVADAEVIFMALPAQMVPNFLREHKGLILPHVILVSTSKGLYLETRQLLSDAIYDTLGRPGQPLVLLSGPSFAKEIIEGHPTTVVCAAQKLHHAVQVQRLMSSTKFRVFTSQDVIGVELGGALKNPLAVGAGIIEGLGYGINTMSAYITRSTQELQALIVAMGGRPETAAGLSGVGDLMLTAFGSLSRNRTCGMRLARGETLDQICQGSTVEGVPTASVAVFFADQCGLDLPIFRAVDKLIAGKLKAERVAEELMSLPLTTEFPSLAPSAPRLGSSRTNSVSTSSGGSNGSLAGLTGA